MDSTMMLGKRTRWKHGFVNSRSPVRSRSPAPFFTFCRVVVFGCKVAKNIVPCGFQKPPSENFFGRRLFLFGWSGMVLGCKKVLKMALNDNLMTSEIQLLGGI